MNCPQCDKPETKVVDSRNSPDGLTIRRRRQCDSCGARFTTYERFQVQTPVIVKGDGRRENFNKEKILRGLSKACQKRPISMTVIDSLVEDVERELVSSGCKEYPSSSLGDLIMAKLLKVDPVSYVRFASFYWNFEDIESFVKNLQKKDKKPGETAP